jgi:hypothetical protein
MSTKKPKTPLADKYLRRMRETARHRAVDFRNEARDASSVARLYTAERVRFEKSFATSSHVATKYDQRYRAALDAVVKKLTKHASDLKRFSTLIYNPETKRFASVEDVKRAHHIDDVGAAAQRLERLTITLRGRRMKAVGQIVHKKEAAAQKKRTEALAKKVADKIGDKIRDELTAPGRMEQSEIPSG